MKLKVFPNFLIIGAHKAGSTSLYEYLRQHPDIYMPPEKEITFFSRDEMYKKGRAFYLKFFENAGDCRLCGEASTSYSSYLNRDLIAKRIYDFNPEVKLIYLLRDPIERAYSAYWYNVRGQVEDYSFKDALLNEGNREDSIRIDPFSYKRRGLYTEIINTYLEYFDKKNILILTLDELKEDPNRLCNKAFKFLKVDNFDVCDLGVKNPASSPKSKIMYRLLNHPSKMRRFFSSQFNHYIKFISFQLC